MPFIVWNDNIGLGIKEIDDQHKVLIDIINNLFDAMSAKRANEILGGIFKELIDYTRYHFSAEEGLMESYKYPEIAQHKSEHEKLTTQVLDLQEQFLQGKVMVDAKLMNFLRDWLIDHIHTSDKKIWRFLNA
ncbi:hemerythrin-like metal-binding protein [Candidatus Magnetobacterium bavaricum]|uniref:Hemerythrin-like metal-binding protein n=1 Tax=Candidatus Magnetobacterium bavaricum TaxID=29290 RepID=A0A0F3GY66_9BACT|nr:hemerythrin-like metal-binding protein [Candidatus Magnetobacterium bavaricum]